MGVGREREEEISLCRLEAISEFELWGRMKEKVKILTRGQKKPISFT